MRPSIAFSLHKCWSTSKIRMPTLWRLTEFCIQLAGLYSLRMGTGRTIQIRRITDDGRLTDCVLSCKGLDSGSYSSGECWAAPPRRFSYFRTRLVLHYQGQ